MTNLIVIFLKTFYIDMNNAITIIEKYLFALITINASIKHFIEIIIHNSF